MHIDDTFWYGSDQSGLICGYVFLPGEVGRAVQVEEALRFLRRSQNLLEGKNENSEGFIWLHFNLANVSAEKWLRENLDLPKEFYESLHEGSRSTRIEHADQCLIAVVNDVLHDFKFEASDIATLWVSVSDQLMISARKTPLQSVDRLRNAVIRGAQFHSTTELLTHLLQDQADVLVGIVRKAIKKVDDIEDHLLADRLNHKRVNLGELRRLLVRLQRLLAPEPSALFRLLHNPPRWIAEDDVGALRQSTEEFAVVISDMASLQERIKLLQEEIAANVNEQNNRSLFVLTVVTVLALPINIIAGLLGMNVGGIPLAEHEHGFWMVGAVVASFTLIAGWLAFRKHTND